jgi:hypothetical protein
MNVNPCHGVKIGKRMVSLKKEWYLIEILILQIVLV